MIGFDLKGITRRGVKPAATKRGEPLADTLWRTIKMAQSFTARELAQLASSEGDPVTTSAASRYCARLADAGILTRTTRRRTDVGYRLIRNVGAAAPKLVAVDIVYDPNSRAFVGPGVAREVKP